jgi:carbonic anhydrase
MPDRLSDDLLNPRHDDRLADAIRRGASMQEIAGLRDPNAKDPEDAITKLKEGNARFFSGKCNRSELGANERRAQIIGQTPYAAVLGCADSRVPIETVFDVSFGDLFVTRVAGNVPDMAVQASLEYAIEHLKIRVVLVLGHEGCGAVEAAMQGEEAASQQAEHVRELLRAIAPAVDGMPSIRDKKARLREAVLHNVRYQVAKLRDNAVIRKAESDGQIRVIGGFYEIGSGAVDLLVEEDELAFESPDA